jgi:nitrite reductase/ring-hydroxylating ferredoxin subunit
MTDTNVGGPVGLIEGLSAGGLHVGSYKRRMKVSLDRMYENALDWEHLPFLHNSSFAWIELIEDGDWGWRAKLGSVPNTGEKNEEDFIILQLHLDRERHRWISSTLEGPGAGCEIWTHAFQVSDDEIEILADFFVPGIAPEARAKVGAVYEKIYAQLYDEDESMMLERKAQLDARGTGLTAGDENLLGKVSDVRANLPMIFNFQQKEYRLLEVDGELIAHATVCPHGLGPLGGTDVKDGVIECPWHGYQFEVKSGLCRTGQSCKLPDSPRIIEDEHSNIIISN